LASSLLIDPFATNDRLWAQKQKRLSQLRDCANQPITAPIDVKQSFLDRCEQFVFDQQFDALFGGMLVKQSKSGCENPIYSKPILANLYLVDILLATDQVFYSGEFSFVANKIVSYLLTKIPETEVGLVETTEWFLLSDLACAFDNKDLKNLLGYNELVLLDALIEDEGFGDKQHRLICYQRSLKTASKQINMHFKQAQIIEHGMRSKLIKRSKSGATNKITGLDGVVSINCALVVALCQLQLFFKYEKLIKIAKTLFSKVLEHVSKARYEQKPLDYHSLVDIAFARLILLQLDFDITVFDQISPLNSEINQQLSNLDSSTRLGEEQQYKANFINQFIMRVTPIFGLELQEIKLPGAEAPNTEFSSRTKFQIQNEAFRFVFLDKGTADLDRKITELRSKYDNRLFVFQIDHPLMGTSLN